MSEKIANKRYVANNRQNLQITVNLPENKGQTTLTFQTGYGLRAEAFFMTADELIQSVLENDARFNKSYRLSEINNVPFAEYNARKVIAEKKKTPVAEPVVEPPKVETKLPAWDEQPPIKPEVKTFTNFLAAKSWLCQNHKATYAELKNKEVLSAKYAEVGFELKIEKS